MRFERKLFLGFGILLILALFFLASRPPNEAEVEYRLPTPNGEGSPVVTRPGSLSGSATEGPRATGEPDPPSGE
jgi:hypothetical protein